MSIINSVTSLVTNLVGVYLPDSPSLASAPQFVQRAFQTVLPFVGYGIAHSKAAPARAHWPSLSVFWRKPGIVTIPFETDPDDSFTQEPRSGDSNIVTVSFGDDDDDDPINLIADNASDRDLGDFLEDEPTETIPKGYVAAESTFPGSLPPSRDLFSEGAVGFFSLSFGPGIFAASDAASDVKTDPIGLARPPRGSVDVPDDVVLEDDEPALGLSPGYTDQIFRLTDPNLSDLISLHRQMLAYIKKHGRFTAEQSGEIEQFLADRMHNLARSYDFLRYEVIMTIAKLRCILQEHTQSATTPNEASDPSFL